MLDGRWTYRAYRDVERLIDADAGAALGLIFGEGVFELRQAADGRVGGALGMAAGHALRIAGAARATAEGDTFSLLGTGLDGTATAGWRYAYRGIAGHRWPDAVDQVPSLLGTVIRLAAHGPDAPAGVTASFIAVRHGDHPPPRTLRPRSSLLR
ncbi:hypothetical protein [Acidisphaera rubrifaciens]|uniref:Uncharacterized protein n=1 Tax=Acidisphaera rubrifaciens HS-AP3 TaxID=1231350 RepID=A0A0D6PAE2_9PROT|nr:hypothetical protein [Acidisphaera rubrifaciens]GAN78163.1 hypothetical protein Asru_0660_05 [Acidisphaera rubrifaciens HS-AP3]